MDIKVNYFYKRIYWPTNRHSKERADCVEGYITVPITTPEATEFPVAFIVKDYKSVYNGARSYDEFDGNGDFKMLEEEIRTYKGNLYMPIRVTHGAAVSTIFVDPKDYLTKELTPRKPFIYSDMMDEPFTDQSIVISTNDDETRQSILKKATGFVVFNGIVWERCEEPMYVVNTFGLGHNHGGTGFFIEYHYNPNIPNINYFNALQRKEAIEYGKKVAAGRGDTDSIPGLGDHEIIEVLMPEMVKRNPQKDHGGGNPFLNDVERLITATDSAAEAELALIAMMVEKKTFRLPGA